jgi:hypothetical protein
MTQRVPYPRDGHHHPRKRSVALRAALLIGASLLVMATAAFVEDARVAAQARGGEQEVESAPTILGSEITWTPEVEFENALLVVVGRGEPRTVKQFTFGARDVLRVDVSRAGLNDGRYKYELFLYPPASGRSGAATQRVTIRSGVFLVRGGFPVAPKDLDAPRQPQAPPRGGGLP